MTKKIIIMVAGLIFITTCLISFAKGQSKEKQLQKAKEKQQVILYASPTKDSKVLDRLDVSYSLVCVFNKGGWVKVGDPKNGRIGWINKEQYKKAAKENYRENFQTVFIERTEQNGDKPINDIVAYKKGKKLAKKEAIKLYNHMQKNQRKMQRRWRHFMHALDRDFFQEEKHVHSPFALLDHMPMIRPIFCFGEEGKTKKDKK